MPASSSCRESDLDFSPCSADWGRARSRPARRTFFVEPEKDEFPFPFDWGPAGWLHDIGEKTIRLVRSFPESDSLADEAKFNRLVREWQKGSAIQSSMVQIAMRPAYQQMIGMGEKALPFIFAQLKSEGNEPDHWFWALAAITTANPIPTEMRGRVADMAKAWLQWGSEHGYTKLD